jgi:hypothetical protein
LTFLSPVFLCLCSSTPAQTEPISVHEVILIPTLFTDFAVPQASLSGAYLLWTGIPKTSFLSAGLDSAPMSVLCNSMEPCRSKPRQ